MENFEPCVGCDGTICKGCPNGKKWKWTLFAIVVIVVLQRDVGVQNVVSSFA